MGVLIFTETGIKGSVPGDMKLVVDDDAGQPQRLVILGIQSRNYSADASAALYYECETRTPLSGAAVGVGVTGATGAGSNVLRQANLLEVPQPVMSTQAAGGGDHLAHIGAFRFWQRIYVFPSNTGIVSLRLEWGQGDLARTAQNATVEIPANANGTLLLVDLGIVSIEKVTQGPQQWEGHVQAWSTVAGDNIDLDRFFLAPIDEGYGEVAARYTYRQGIITSRDDFTGTIDGAVLNGRVAPLGGTWATAGAAVGDFECDTDPDGAETVSRSTTADADRRYALLTGTNYTNVEVSARVRHSASSLTFPYPEVIARWNDASNYLAFRANAGVLDVNLYVLGVLTNLARVDYTLADDTNYTLRLIVYASGGGIATLLDDAGTVLAEAAFYHEELATGGARQTGTVGFSDYNGTGSACTRHYDTLYAGTPAAEMLAIAPGRSLELRSDGAWRQDAAGVLWVSAPYEGFYPRVPPAWLEGRSVRFLVATCRGPEMAPGVWANPGIDPLSARLTYTPRTLNLPE